MMKLGEQQLISTDNDVEGADNVSEKATEYRSIFSDPIFMPRNTDQKIRFHHNNVVLDKFVEIPKKNASLYSICLLSDDTGNFINRGYGSYCSAVSGGY